MDEQFKDIKMAPMLWWKIKGGVAQAVSDNSCACNKTIHPSVCQSGELVWSDKLPGC